MLILLLALVEYLFYILLCTLLPTESGCLLAFLLILIIIVHTESVIERDCDPILPGLLFYPISSEVKRDQLGFYLSGPHGFFGDTLFFQFFLSDPSMDQTKTVHKAKPRFYVASELYAFPFISWLITMRGGRPAERSLITRMNEIPRLYGLLPGGAREIRTAHLNTPNTLHYYYREKLFQYFVSQKQANIYWNHVLSVDRCGYGYSGHKEAQNVIQKVIGYSFPLLWIPKGFSFDFKLQIVRNESVRQSEDDFNLAAVIKGPHSETDNKQNIEVFFLNTQTDTVHNLPESQDK